ncbi:MAG TPA: tRNA uridine-5-carboxymethylaminomethyl(34) synthesis GTPase MnmE [Candidatus Avimonoglobus intestinipullorum]|uniref:tRNA modification GTPase MnmE n=1 Tax=Candidatus Avimonoglobus intestinipullorum TaxID=2840699 RepID=A0A9D1LWE5_9FIRM|nr:tRNA uridine-5-carboxymethylaminomethyl(34) synthesis GTPase MnmE [Candidatus Avimonoglobus intestinipullorum]
MKQKTIAAISTPAGTGGIAVIRISGAEAVEIADRVFKGKDRLSEALTHTVHYGHMIDRDGEVIDEVLVSVMRAPRTFTREDVVEVSTHGGMQAPRRVLRALIEAGAVPAEAGEFTKRAFLNGRIDLSQAEAVIDIINAKTELAQKNAISQAGGGLAAEIGEIRSALVRLAAGMQVAIDYPDEDLEDVTPEEMQQVLAGSLAQVQKLLRTASSGKIIRDGISTAIVGKPNVGKSSLLNRLAREERSIVTDIAGTTRDVVEEYIDLDGVMLRLMDTAGIRQTEDVVEKIGVERSLRSMDEAELLLVLLDAAAGIDEEDEELLARTSGRKRIIVVNKTDIGGAAPAVEGAVYMSAKTGEGADELAAKIRELYALGDIGGNHGAIVTNMRHVAALAAAEAALVRAAEALSAGMPQDIVSIDINIAIEALGEITGETVSEEIVAAIFHNFCVGK